MGRFFARFMGKSNEVQNEMDKYQEAITFAEAGEHEHAERLFQADGAEEVTRKLLVVGRDHMC